MKVAATILVCLFVGCYSRSREDLRQSWSDEGNPESQDQTYPGQKWKYVYETKLLTGVPSLKNKYVGQAIKFEVEVLRLRNQYFKMQVVDEVKSANINAELPAKPSIYDDQRLNYNHDQIMQDKLVHPIYFKMSHGIVTEIRGLKNDSYWSVNLKVALVNIFSTNRSQVEIMYNEATRQQLSVSKFLTERSTEGTCKTMYEVFPSKQGPEIQQLFSARSQQSSRPLSDETSKDLFQFSKTVLLDQCKKRIALIDVDSAVKYCPSCQSQAVNIGESSKSSYVMDKTTYTVKSAALESEFFIPGMGKQTAAIFSSQKLEQLPSPGQGPSDESLPDNVVLPTTSFNVPKTLLEQLQTRTDSGTTVDQDFMLQQLAQLDNHFEFKSQQIQSIKNQVLEGFNKIAEDLVGQKPKTSEPTKEVGIWKLTNSLSYLPHSDLQDIYNQFSNNQQAEKQQIKRKLFLDCLTMTGSKDAYKLFEELIDSRKISYAEATELATGTQEAIAMPKISAIDSLTKMCTENEIVQNKTLLHSAICLSTAQLVHRVCKSQQHMRISPSTLKIKLCQPEQMKRVVQKLAFKIRSSTTQQRAIYIQALGATGSKYAIPHIAHEIQEQRNTEVLRAAALMALKDIAIHFPEEVLKVALPVYNNRVLPEIVRIAASSLVISSNPPFPVLEKMALDLSHETDNQVGSFVYTTLHTLANATRHPALQQLAVNASKAVKLAVPFQLDRTSSFKKIITLWDLSKNVNMMSDNEYVSSKKMGVPKYFSSLNSVTLPGKIVTKIFEATFLQNKMEREIVKQVLEKLKPVLPEQWQSLLQMVQQQQEQPSQNSDGQVSMKLFERTLVLYLTQDSYRGFKEQVQSIVKSIEEKLQNPYTHTYVKVMLPMKSGASIALSSGLPACLFKATEILVSLRMKDLQLTFGRNSTSVNGDEQKKLHAKGKIEPFVHFSSAYVLGFLNPAHQVFYSTGKQDMYMAHTPIGASVEHYSYQKKSSWEPNSKTDISLKPQVDETWIKHSSYPFVSVSGQSSGMKPIFEDSVAQKLNLNPYPIKYKMQVGTQSKLGIGMKLDAVSENPWSKNTLPWMKMTRQPFEELPGTLFKLAINPWMQSRNFTLSLARGTDPAPEINIEMKYRKSKVNNQALYGTVSRSGEQGKLFEYALERLYSDDMTENTLIAAYNKQHDVWECIRLDLPKEGQSEELKLVVGIADSKTCSQLHKTHISVNRQTKTEQVQMDELEQPLKSLTSELKKRCEWQKERLLSVGQHPQKEMSEPCKKAIQNQAVIKGAEFDVKLSPEAFQKLPLPYVKYLLYPFISVKGDIARYPHQGKFKVEAKKLDGIDVTSMKIKPSDDEEKQCNVTNVKHQSKVINKMISELTEQKIFQSRKQGTVLPKSGVCVVSGSEVVTFDGVKHQIQSSNQPEHVAVESKFPLKFKLVTKRQNGQLTGSLRIGETQIELVEGSTDIKVDGERKRLPQEIKESSTGMKIVAHHRQSTNSVEITVPSLQFNVTKNKRNFIVKVPQLSRGQTEGLCGDNNGEQVEEILKKHRNIDVSLRIPRPTWRTPSEEFPFRQSGQEQRSPQQTKNIQEERKRIDRSDVTCISERPVSICKPGYNVQQVKEVLVHYDCRDGKGASYRESVIEYVPTSCQRL